MPEWAIGVLSAIGAAAGAWAAIRVELRFVWRDLSRVESRVGDLESGRTVPRRRLTDVPRARRDA